MMKRADRVEVGDVLADYGRVEVARLRRFDQKAPTSYAGMPRRPRKVVCPPFKVNAAVVELRTDRYPIPLYRWPKDKLELAA